MERKESSPYCEGIILLCFDLVGGFLRDPCQVSSFVLPNPELSQGGKLAFFVNTESYQVSANWRKIAVGTNDTNTKSLRRKLVREVV